eukprot:g7949.t1
MRKVLKVLERSVNRSPKHSSTALPDIVITRLSLASQAVYLHTLRPISTSLSPHLLHASSFTSESQAFSSLSSNNNDINKDKKERPTEALKLDRFGLPISKLKDALPGTPRFASRAPKRLASDIKRRLLLNLWCGLRAEPHGAQVRHRAFTLSMRRARAAGEEQVQARMLALARQERAREQQAEHARRATAASPEEADVLEAYLPDKKDAVFRDYVVPAGQETAEDRRHAAALEKLSQQPEAKGEFRELSDEEVDRLVAETVETFLENRSRQFPVYPERLKPFLRERAPAEIRRMVDHLLKAPFYQQQQHDVKMPDLIARYSLAVITGLAEDHAQTDEERIDILVPQAPQLGRAVTVEGIPEKCYVAVRRLVKHEGRETVRITYTVPSTGTTIVRNLRLYNQEDMKYYAKHKQEGFDMSNPPIRPEFTV